MKKFLVMMVLFFVLVAHPVFAAGDKMSDKKEAQWFFGAGYLKSEADLNITETSTISVDDEDGGFKVFVGRQFNPYFGLELAYADIGEFSAENSATTARAASESWSINLGGIFSLPLDKITQKASLKWITPYVKLGGYYWDTDAQGSIGGVQVVSATDDGFDFFFGGGVSINLHRNFAIRGEWERFTGDDDLDGWSANIVFKF